MSSADLRIIPMLAYENGVAAMDWLCRVFGFLEKTKILDDNGTLIHGEITLGSGIVMLTSFIQDYQSPRHHRQVCEDAAKWYRIPYIINGVLVYVDDVEKHYQIAIANEATILSDMETGYQGMLYRAEDLEGQRWMFMQKT
ncbi:MAG: VOC family protein [Ferruginibacter sp.]